MRLIGRNGEKEYIKLQEMFCECSKAGHPQYSGHLTGFKIFESIYLIMMIETADLRQGSREGRVKL